MNKVFYTASKIGLVLMVLIGLFILSKMTYSVKAVEPIKINGFYLPTAKKIDDFQLMDNQGRFFQKNSLKNHWTLMFFGFTNCGMVCPTTMVALNKMYHILAQQLPKDQLPQIVMVSVDPARDSVKRMNEYVTAFNKVFVGARAERAATQKLEQQLNIVAAKLVADGNGPNHYTINHSAEIFVFNPNGDLQAMLSYPHEAQDMVNDYKAILSHR